MTTTDPLVSVDWLAARLDDPTIRILDASYRMPAMRPPTAREEYEARHIPGAGFYDIDAIADASTALPHMLPPPLLFGRLVGRLGVENDTTIVVYDRGDWMGAPRAWWTFRVFGHDDVKVLDGGLKAWAATERPLVPGDVAFSQTVFHAHLRPELVRAKSDMLDNIASGAEQVVDARAADRFEGRVAEPWPGRRSGHIPNSRNVPFNVLVDAQTGLMKSPDEIRTIFAQAGIQQGRPIVTTCGSGVTAGVLAVALARAGFPDAALYDGSWAEWGLPDGPPIATGGA